MAQSFFRSCVRFFQHQLWQALPTHVPRYQRFFFQLLRIFVLAGTRFRRNQGALKASALTFFSTLSIVPAIVIGLGISEGFGFDIRRAISSYLEAQEEVLEELLYLADRLLHNTRGDWIAGVGLLVLFYTILRLLHYVEDAFNAIWDIRTPRPLARKITEYTTLLFTSPLLIIFSSSLNVYLSAQIKSYSQEAQWISYVSPFLVAGLRTLPYVSLWLLLSLLYIVMPNTRVRPLSAVWAGILSGTAFQLLQWVYIHLQVGVATYNVLYGSLAAIPLFLLWLYWSWAIVLFGAEWAFAYQNLAYHTLPPRSLSVQEKQGIALLITRWIAEAFHKGKPPMDLGDLSKVSRLPQNFLRDVVRKLVACGVLSRIQPKKPSDSTAYQPAMDTHALTAHEVLSRLDTHGNSDFFEKYAHLPSADKIKTVLIARSEWAKRPHQPLVEL